jgi:PAS domain S-box-containing protein
MTEEERAAELAQARLAAIVASSSDAIVSKTLHGIVTSWNRAAEEIFGYTADEMVGTSIRTLIPEDRQREEDWFLTKLRSGEQIKDFETIRQRKDGRLINVAVTVSPVHDADGRIVGASKIARDITGRVTVEQRLEDSELRFRALADNMAQLAWIADPDGSIFWYNKRWYEFTGTTLDEMKGWGWKAVHHPDHVDRVVESIQYSWDTGVEWEDTFPLRGKDGEYRWFLSRAVPIRDGSGRVLRWIGTNTDITEERQYTERISILLDEVNHRAKNLLSVIQVIAKRTAAGEPEEFIGRFQDRLAALAASQDLLVKGRWTGVQIDRLVQSQLAHLPEELIARVVAEGEAFELSAAASQTLGMVIHELATNAAKYGALANEAGAVEIKWEVENGMMRLEWCERGGPPVAPPECRGFGTTVICNMPETMLEGEVSLDFEPEGLVWRAAFPLAALRPMQDVQR